MEEQYGTEEVWGTGNRREMVDLKHSPEQLRKAAERWNERALSGQTVAFAKGEGHLNPEERERDRATYWTGTLTTAEGVVYKLERCRASELLRLAEKKGMHFAKRPRSKQDSLLKGVYGRTSIERDEAAQKAIGYLTEYLAADPIAIMIKWDEEATIAEISAALYSADMEAKPLRPETKAEKAAREQVEAINRIKQQAIEALVAAGLSREEATNRISSSF